MEDQQPFKSDFDLQVERLAQSPISTKPTITPTPFAERQFDLRIERDVSFYVIRKTYANFSAAATSSNVVIMTLPNLEEIVSAWFNVRPSFSGGAIATYTIELGTSLDTDGLVTAEDAMAVGIKKTRGADFTTGRPIYSLTAGQEILATARTTVANLSAATQGVVDFYIATIKWPGNA